MESFTEKLSRPGKSYANPIEEITDLCGLRVILYYQEDVDSFCDAIRREFLVDDMRSVDKRHQLRSDQFGYISVHLICRLNSNRSSLLEWSPYANLNIEIQVRTVLQHAWASISHALQYKNQADIPDQFVRQLTRVSGLLELSDEQFSDLRRKTEALRSEISLSLNKNDLNVVINFVALKEFTDSSSVVAEIETNAREAGLGVDEDSDPAQLVAVCNGLSVATLDQLNEILASFVKHALKFFQHFMKLEVMGEMSPKIINGSRGHWCAVAVVAMKHKSSSLAFIEKEDIWDSEYLSNVVNAAKHTRV